MDQICGYIERVTYQNPENGYTVAQLQEGSRAELVCIVGIMPALQPGETIRCQGAWKRHLIHGKQFSVAEYKQEVPADVVGIEKYLGSGLIKGIGPSYAKKIVTHFGRETLDIIDRFPDRLEEIPGIGPKRAALIKSCWQDQKSIRDVMVFLQSYNVTPGFAQKIYKVYGKKSIEIVKENPYALARDIRGIGFKTADHLASNLGILKEAPQRIDAGVEYVLGNLAEDGHVCVPVDEFLRIAQEILEVPQDLINSRLAALNEESRIVVANQVYEGELQSFIWLKSLHTAESGIVRELLRLKKSPCFLRQVEADKALLWVQENLNIRLAEKQAQAVHTAVSEKMQVITGGPGTGKSTITKAILAITKKLTSRILLCAPTGRAAKRMGEITQHKAVTIHSLLEYDFKAGAFKRNRSNPLECDLLIVDEASMIDTVLMHSLLKAIPNEARVIFVGDIYQLPSVGPGNVLKDVIASKFIPVTLLNEIFRQAAGSRIITNAHKINSGLMPDCQNSSDSDFFFLEVENPEDILKNIIGLVSQRLPQKYGFNPFHQIQVLAPMKRGIIGTENLNVKLQEILNPKSDFLMRGGNRFLIGDKIMQTRNDYKKGVFNGDIGMIKNIDSIEQEVVVQIEEKDVIYEFHELDDLVLAYAVSIHKYQGSECPCIVMPIHTAHFKLLHRNLVYTGVTRGKQLVVIVGTKKALGIAVRNDEVKRRYTGLFANLIDSQTVPLRALQ